MELNAFSHLGICNFVYCVKTQDWKKNSDHYAALMAEIYLHMLLRKRVLTDRQQSIHKRASFFLLGYVTLSTKFFNDLSKLIY